MQPSEQEAPPAKAEGSTQPNYRDQAARMRQLAEEAPLEQRAQIYRAAAARFDALAGLEESIAKSASARSWLPPT